MINNYLTKVDFGCVKWSCYEEATSKGREVSTDCLARNHFVVYLLLFYIQDGETVCILYDHLTFIDAANVDHVALSDNDIVILDRDKILLIENIEPCDIAKSVSVTSSKDYIDPLAILTEAGVPSLLTCDLFSFIYVDLVRYF